MWNGLLALYKCMIMFICFSSFRTSYSFMIEWLIVKTKESERKKIMMKLREKKEDRVLGYLDLSRLEGMPRLFWHWPI